MTTPLADSPRSTTYRATPSAQRRTASKVNSSAIRARQPSVPKTMVVGSGARRTSVNSYLRNRAALDQCLDEGQIGPRPAQHGERLRGGDATALGRGDDTEPPTDAPHDQIVGLDGHRLAR